MIMFQKCSAWLEVLCEAEDLQNVVYHVVTCLFALCLVILERISLRINITIYESYRPVALNISLIPSRVTSVLTYTHVFTLLSFRAVYNNSDNRCAM